MAQAKRGLRSAPVVQMLIGLKQAKPAKRERGTSATIDDFEREQMGVAAKE